MVTIIHPSSKFQLSSRSGLCGVTGMQARGFGEVHNPSDASSFETSRAKLIFSNLKFSMLPIGM